VTVHRDYIIIIKPTRRTNFSNLFRNKNLHVSDCSSVHHQEFFTVHTAITGHTVTADSLLAGSGRSCILILLYDIYHKQLLCVQRKTPDDGQRICPKHEDFYSKNKFKKLVYLIGFVIRIQGNVYLLTATPSEILRVLGHLVTRVETRIPWVWVPDAAFHNS